MAKMDNEQAPRSVLVVEDQEEISLQMKSMLLGKGHRVFQAANAQTAIEIAEKEHPKLILTDLADRRLMPDGYVLLVNLD